MKREPLKRIVWRRVHPDGTVPAKLTRTALRPHEEENVRAAVRLLKNRLGTWDAVSKAMTVPAKTMARVMSGERRVQDKWAVLVARALGIALDDIVAGRLTPPGRMRCLRAPETEHLALAVRSKASDLLDESLRLVQGSCADMDLYSLLVPLTASLDAIDQELDRVTAPLFAKRAKVQAEIDALAAQIVAAKDSGQSSSVEVHSPAQEGLPRIPPRRLRLLAALKGHPDIDFGELTIAMYGRDERSTRGALSAEFSGLKAEGLVEPVEGTKGKFVLTPLALRALAAQPGAGVSKPSK